VAMKKYAKATAIATLILTGCIGCNGEVEADDPRALADSMSGVDLETALAEFKLNLPTSVTEVQFGYYSAVETNLDLKYVADCDAVIDEVRADGVTEPGVPVTKPSLATTVARRHGWAIDWNRSRFFEAGPDPIYRAFVVSQLSGARCQAVIAAFR
jgi:hypothetical protein